MSHPHDGYDSELDLDYGPGDDFYFAWSGDESNTIMHYMDLSTNFGRFDRDNMYRWETAGYLNLSNELLEEIRVLEAVIDQPTQFANKIVPQFLGQAENRVSARQADSLFTTADPDSTGTVD